MNVVSEVSRPGPEKRLLTFSGASKPPSEQGDIAISPAAVSEIQSSINEKCSLVRSGLDPSLKFLSTKESEAAISHLRTKLRINLISDSLEDARERQWAAAQILELQDLRKSNALEPILVAPIEIDFIAPQTYQARYYNALGRFYSLRNGRTSLPFERDRNTFHLQRQERLIDLLADTVKNRNVDVLNRSVAARHLSLLIAEHPKIKAGNELRSYARARIKELSESRLDPQIRAIVSAELGSYVPSLVLAFAAPLFEKQFVLSRLLRPTKISEADMERAVEGLIRVRSARSHELLRSVFQDTKQRLSLRVRILKELYWGESSADLLKRAFRTEVKMMELPDHRAFSVMLGWKILSLSPEDPEIHKYFGDLAAVGKLGVTGDANLQLWDVINSQGSANLRPRFLSLMEKLVKTETIPELNKSFSWDEPGDDRFGKEIVYCLLRRGGRQAAKVLWDVATLAQNDETLAARLQGGLNIYPVGRRQQVLKQFLAECRESNFETDVDHSFLEDGANLLSGRIFSVGFKRLERLVDRNREPKIQGASTRIFLSAVDDWNTASSRDKSHQALDDMLERPGNFRSSEIRNINDIPAFLTNLSNKDGPFEILLRGHGDSTSLILQPKKPYDKSNGFDFNDESIHASRLLNELKRILTPGSHVILQSCGSAGPARGGKNLLLHLAEFFSDIPDLTLWASEDLTYSSRIVRDESAKIVSVEYEYGDENDDSVWKVGARINTSELPKISKGK